MIKGTNQCLKHHLIKVEGNCIVDHNERRTIAKFEPYNGTREELSAIIERANSSSLQDVGRDATVLARNAVIEEVWQQFNDYTDNHMMHIKAIKAVISSLASRAKP